MSAAADAQRPDGRHLVPPPESAPKGRPAHLAASRHSSAPYPCPKSAGLTTTRLRLTPVMAPARAFRVAAASCSAARRAAPTAGTLEKQFVFLMELTRVETHSDGRSSISYTACLWEVTEALERLMRPCGGDSIGRACPKTSRSSWLHARNAKCTNQIDV